MRERMAATFPDFIDFTQKRLFGEIWNREGLSPRDRSLITVAMICASYQPAALDHHLQYAVQNGVTKSELKEVKMHVAFYAGWPSAVSAMQHALDFLEDREQEEK
ncbi:carboxymuconolactone decarboxylase family protein [Novosphingobium mathurense]|nr:carboxymuconolactone decarboxylase family protein [Novosphingobium mathurense]